MINKMKNKVLVAGLISGILLAGSANATTFSYSTRVEFNTAQPGLALEDFNATNDPTSNFFTGPLSSASNDAVWATGDILPGITLNSTEGTDLYHPAAGQSSQPTEAVGISQPRSGNWQIDFDIPVNAMAVDIWGNNASGFQFGFPITAVANVYTTGNVLFYSAGITIQSGEAGGFFGLASTTDLITA